MVSKVEGRGPIDPHLLMHSCTLFRLVPSRVKSCLDLIPDEIYRGLSRCSPLRVC